MKHAKALGDKAQWDGQECCGVDKRTFKAETC